MTFWLFILFYFIWANLFQRHPVVDEVTIADVTIGKAEDIRVVQTEMRNLSTANIPQISFKSLLNESRLEFLIRYTWDGDWVSHRPAKVCLTGLQDGLEVEIEAPYFGDPPGPDWDPIKPYYGLWNHEEVEVFFLNDDNQYFQAELGPHGQYLALTFTERRKTFKEGLLLNYTADITLDTSSWVGKVVIPWAYFPPNVTKFNAYGIHGSEDAREYDAAFPAHKGASGPDFHNLKYFQEIPFREILPDSFSNDKLSDVWTQSGSAVNESVTPEPEKELSYLITQTWDSLPLTHDGIRLTLSPGQEGLDIAIEAPYFRDPPAPDGPPGEPFYGLWDYEVVEAFFLNEKNQYLELEFGPHGHHLVLLLRDIRNVSMSELPLLYLSEISSDERSWLGHATVPWEYFPPNVTLFNAYAIHGSGDNRTYEALYPVATGAHKQPDFHRLEAFKPINFKGILKEDFDNTQISPLWVGPEDLGPDADVSSLMDVREDEQRELTIPQEEVTHSPEVVMENAKELPGNTGHDEPSDARRVQPKSEFIHTKEDVPKTRKEEQLVPSDTKEKEVQPDFMDSLIKDMSQSQPVVGEVSFKDTKESDSENLQFHKDKSETPNSAGKVISDNSAEQTSPQDDKTSSEDIKAGEEANPVVSMPASDNNVPEETVTVSMETTATTDEIPFLSYSLEHTWNGLPVRRAPINVTLSSSDTGILVYIEAPYYGDPPRPREDPKKPFYDIDTHEIVDMLFLNDQNKYLEVIVGPHGHYHIRTYYDRESISLEGLTLNVSSQIYRNFWEAETTIPWDYLPPRITKFNIYAAHAAGIRRVYHALYPHPPPKSPIPTQERKGNFHILEDYRPIPLDTILPESFDNTQQSIIWSSIDTLFKQDLIRGKRRRMI